jgi:hypothetical protein
MNLRSGATGKAGAVIEQAHSDIYAPLSAKETEILNRVINSKRTLDIESYKPDVESPRGLGEEAHRQYLDNLERIEGITPEQKAKLLSAADKHQSVIKSQLDDLKNDGIINQEQYDNLSSHFYSKREFLQHIDPERTYDVGGGNPKILPDSGIKALDKGSAELLDTNSERLLAEVVARTQGRIFNNRANKALYNLALNTPENGIVSINPSKNATKLHTFIDGDEHTFYINKDYANDWVGHDPYINQSLATWIQWLSGSNILKATATGYNPAFVITNVPRDLALIWSQSEGYSAHLPVAIPQMAADLIQVLPDVLKRKGRVIDATNEGLEFGFLTDYGRFKGQGHVIEKVNSITDALGWLGKTSELWSRMAYR